MIDASLDARNVFDPRQILAVVCHDAGSANLMAHWLGGYRGVIEPHVSGPAERIWQKVFGDKFESRSIEEVVGRSDVVFAGSGWSSNAEFDALKHGKKQGKRTVAALDHWVNYKQRFVRDDLVVEPDEFVVFDIYAYHKASAEFPESKIWLLDNVFLANCISDIAGKSVSPSSYCKILYVTEPIRERWNNSNESGEFQALRYFLDRIWAVAGDSEPLVCLRPHPSEDESKYDCIMAEYPDVRIMRSSEMMLASDIAWANAVIGVESYALVIALAAGREVYSSIPPCERDIYLPHSGIRRIRSIVK